MTRKLSTQAQQMRSQIAKDIEELAQVAYNAFDAPGSFTPQTWSEISDSRRDDFRRMVAAILIHQRFPKAA